MKAAAAIHVKDRMGANETEQVIKCKELTKKNIYIYIFIYRAGDQNSHHAEPEPQFQLR